jgi:hypothetical protein
MITGRVVGDGFGTRVNNCFVVGTLVGMLILLAVGAIDTSVSIVVKSAVDVNGVGGDVTSPISRYSIVDKFKNESGYPSWS